MSKRLFKRIAALLVTAVMVCSICLPVSAAGYGTVNSKASSVKIAATGGGDFILKKNTATITFKMKNNCQVRVYVQDSAGKTVWYKDVASVKANKNYTVKWSGKKTSGSYVSFSSSYKKYRVCVRAGSTKTYSSYIKLYKKCDFAGGVGSKKDPYQVKTAAHLAKIASHPSRYFVQTADIDYNYADAPMISAAFSGHYDGDGYAIKNAMYRAADTTASIAMFSSITSKGVVQNMTFTNCTAMNAQNAAIIALENSGTITDCTVKDAVVNTVGLGYGAVLCVTNNGEVTDCTVDGAKLTGSIGCTGFVSENYGRLLSTVGSGLDLICTEPYTNMTLGGIVRFNYESGIVKDCTATGKIDSGVNNVAFRNRGLIQNCRFNGSQDVDGNYGTVK